MRKLLLSLALGLGLMASTATAAEESPNKGNLSFEATVDVVSNYYFRGYLQSNSGIIVQPGFALTLNVWGNDQFDVALTGGVWSSIHSDQKSDALGAANQSPEAWYETDFYVKVESVIAKQFKVGLIYTLYTYPSYASGEIHEVGVQGSWSSAETAKQMGSPVTFDVYGGVYFEVYDDSFAGADENIFAKVGVALGLIEPIKAGDFTIGLNFPIELGLSLDEYFVDSGGSNEFFGYVMLGAEGSVMLPVPAQYGAWKLIVGGYYHYLGADSLDLTNNGNNNAFTGKVGLAIAY